MFSHRPICCNVLLTDTNPFQQSQTQSGNRYTPHLTRFYAALGPALLMPLVQESLEAMNVRCKVAPVREDQHGQASLRLRIGGYDRRKVMFKGWVEVERFTYRGSEGSFCVMQRDVVCVVLPFFIELLPRYQFLIVRLYRAIQSHGASCGRR
jgi:hypothetical protein